MRQTLHVTFDGNVPKNFLKTVVQAFAREHNLEGIGQIKKNDGLVDIIISGPADNIELFVDMLHEQVEKRKLHPLEIEPHISNKDFRGVFRVLE